MFVARDRECYVNKNPSSQSFKYGHTRKVVLVAMLVLRLFLFFVLLMLILCVFVFADG